MDNPTIGQSLFVWSGLSTDTKPSGAIEGQKAIETDTGNVYQWLGDGGGQWWIIGDHGRGLVNTLLPSWPVVNEYFHLHTGVTDTIAVATSQGDTTIVLADSTGFLEGDRIQINGGVLDQSFPLILSIATNTLTIDRQIDAEHAIGIEVEVVDLDLDAVGSLAAPKIFIVEPPNGQIWHIERLILTMGHSTAGDLGLFGNLAALTNGCIFRVKIGEVYSTFSNWKTNGGIKGDMFDVVFDTRSGGGGTYGTSARGSFNRIGINVRLDGNKEDRLEFLVQDDIAAITAFNMKGQGYKHI